MASPAVTIAVEGCCHGELDAIYDSIRHAQEAEGVKIDLLICCGDFQAVRNRTDLECLACPPKYRSMRTFYKYYTGEAIAPVLTLFIGGNHEASNYLRELHYGGWVAPNIFFLGTQGVVNFGGLRIGGLSGIYKEGDFNKGYYEKPPYNGRSIRSAYHVRAFDYMKLGLLSRPMDVFLSHDWPRNMAKHGDTQALFRAKSFLRKEVLDGSLGSPPSEMLLQHLQPRYWFSAHLHVKFPALVVHPPATAGAAPTTTRFLSLDKCLPKREFLQILSIEPRADAPGIGSRTLQYDTEWLAITRATHAATPLAERGPPPPLPAFDRATAMKETAELLPADLSIPMAFTCTVPAFNPAANNRGRPPPARHVGNPQTDAFLAMLRLPHVMTVPYDGSAAPMPSPAPVVVAAAAAAPDPAEIDIDVDDAGGSAGAGAGAGADPAELDIDGVEEDDTVETPAAPPTAAAEDPAEVDIDDL